MGERAILGRGAAGRRWRQYEEDVSNMGER